MKKRHWTEKLCPAMSRSQDRACVGPHCAVWQTVSQATLEHEGAGRCTLGNGMTDLIVLAPGEELDNP